MKLNAVEIKGMWGKHNLRWDLDPRVNILTGINGVGKSTIMDLIASVIMTNSLSKDLVTKAERVNIELSNKDTLVCLSFNDTLLKLRKEAESSPVYRELWEDVSRSVSITATRQQRLNRMGITASVSYLVRGKEQLLPLSDKMIDGLNVNIVSTFDSSLPGGFEQSRIDTLREQGIRSTLDMALHSLQERYAYYLGGLAKRMEQNIKEGKPVDRAFVDALYAPKNLFVRIVNELFAQTGKHINIDNSRLEFVIDDEDKHISMYELSSGRNN